MLLEIGDYMLPILSLRREENQLISRREIAPAEGVGQIPSIAGNARANIPEVVRWSLSGYNCVSAGVDRGKLSMNDKSRLCNWFMNIVIVKRCSKLAIAFLIRNTCSF